MIGDRWGVRDDEVARHFPCDDLVATPVLQAWRGVTVAAAPAELWPWVAQIRLAPYSYDWIDNAARRSPRELRGLPEPRPGENFTAVGGRPVGCVLSVEPGVHYTGRIMGTVVSYLLVAEDDGTRLLMKLVTARARWAAPLLSVGDLVMARRQLLTLGRLAERD
ncbi:hypothetical protein SAMN05443575_3053 [Jatrophihabitans endophyticus]|uniref:Polyketide cyclase / dehydrase and lipid transport n=1 Tax=Jatrophihabitans endophyticus TaxID=1206085 RepID=A0A1M5PDL8_9ACTN|nr:polyketide cyclase [Jatrophihabitans endophyticus]SHG99884.1 hypothetical protein SAMN05443575_3053 [Jatrophihabitans endophyticus]